MTLLQLQAAQVRLYLDQSARDALRLGDRSLAVDFSLDEREFEQLRRMAVDQAEGMELFARILLKKRAERLAQYYPLVKRYLGSEWQPRVDAYVRRSPIPVASAAEDAVAFGGYLADCNVNWVDDDIIPDLVVYERTKAEVTADSRSREVPPQCGLYQPSHIRPILASTARIRTLRHSPKRLIDRMVAGDTASLEAPEDGVVIVFFRGAGDLGVAASEVGAWLGAVLQRADGRSSLDEIMFALGIGDDPSTIGMLVDVLQRLCRVGMIELLPKELAC